MARSSRRRNSVILALVLVLVAGSATSAHRRDEYLQAARLTIDPDRVEIALDLTPGMAVAERVLADIDADRNGSISAGEAQIYVGRLLSTLALDVDGTPLALNVLDRELPDVDAMLNGQGTMRLRLVAAMPRLADGVHHLRYRNRHQPEIGAYLANVLVPASERVTIASQHRDVDQRELTVEYRLGADANARARAGLSLGAITLLVWLTTVWWRRPRALGRQGKQES